MTTLLITSAAFMLLVSIVFTTRVLVLQISLYRLEEHMEHFYYVGASLEDFMEDREHETTHVEIVDLAIEEEHGNLYQEYLHSKTLKRYVSDYSNCNIVDSKIVNKAYKAGDDCEA